MRVPAQFKNFMDWRGVLNRRTEIGARPAIYMLVLSRGFGRLRGKSSILYIGCTGMLGGASDRCRLRTYKYPNGRHASEINRRARQLLRSGRLIRFHWAFAKSKDEALKTEAALLSQYHKLHLELPPFNGRSQI